jgi:hypothetical protein
MQKSTIGKVYAICDHFEQNTGNPVRSSVLRDATGHDRKQFRRWVREGRLIEHEAKLPSGQIILGYTRPKEEILDATEEVNPS